MGQGEQADATPVRSALWTLLKDASYRMRARELARRAARYDAAATAADAVETFVALSEHDRQPVANAVVESR